MKQFVLPILILFFSITLKAQSSNDVLDLLVLNGNIKQSQADSVRAEAAIKQQEADARKKSFSVNSGKALQIGAYTQVRYQFLQEEGKIDGFDIRRAYVDLKGNLSPYFSYRLQTDFATSPKIIDAQIEVKLADYLNLTLGQQLIPFSLNNLTSNTKLELADRVQTVEALASRKSDVLGDNNGRDLGIAANGSFLKLNGINFIEYRIGVFNGSGINRADLNEDKDVIGRLVFHPIKGLDIGASALYGFTPDSANFYDNNTSIKTKDKVAAKYFGVRERVGAELSYEYKFLNLKAEYIVGKDGSVSKGGYYVQLAAFILPSKLQLAGRYDTYDKDKNVDNNISTNITGGINIVFNSNLLLQLAYTVRSEEGESIDNNFGSVQLQASF